MGKNYGIIKRVFTTAVFLYTLGLNLYISRDEKYTKEDYREPKTVSVSFVKENMPLIQEKLQEGIDKLNEATTKVDLVSKLVSEVKIETLVLEQKINSLDQAVSRLAAKRNKATSP